MKVLSSDTDLTSKSVGVLSLMAIAVMLLERNFFIFEALKLFTNYFLQASGSLDSYDLMGWDRAKFFLHLCKFLI